MPFRSDSTHAAAANQASAERVAILVLGMHRSGTSAIARLLNLRGAELGRDLLPPKDDNERGFWENRALLELHERFLGESGLQWHDLAAREPDWQRDAPARRFVHDLPQVLWQQFAESPLFLVKDPRLSLLTPLWIEALQAQAIRPVFVITLRHPNEVAASLARRDGFPFIQSHLLWLQHIVEAERATRGHARVFVRYEDLLDDWQAQLQRITTSLGLSWPAPGVSFESVANEFIAPSLRHHRDDSEEAAHPLPELVRRVYRLASAASGTTVPQSDFDNAAAEFDRAMDVVAPLQREWSKSKARELEQHGEEIERARQALSIKDGQIEEARGNIDTLANQVREARGNIDILAEQVEQARAAHQERDLLEEQLRAALTSRDADIDQAREVIALKDREVDAARRNIDAMAQQVAHAREIIALKDAEIVEAGRNIDALAADLSSAHNSLIALQETLSKKDLELEAERRASADLTWQIDRAREGFAVKEAEIEAARGNIDALAADIERARQAHAARDNTEAGLHGEIAALRGELGVLREENAALRGSRWFRIGRMIGLLDRKRT